MTIRIWSVAVALAATLAVRSDTQLFAQQPPTQYLMVLRNPDILAELEIDREQADALKELDQVRKKNLDQALVELPKLEASERTAFMRKVAEADASIQDRVYEVLSARQAKRLDQIVLQQKIRAHEVTGGLLHPKMIEALELTDSQKADIKDRAMTAEKDLQERIARLQREIVKAQNDATQELLNRLDFYQRRRYREMIGETFRPEARR